MTKERDQLTFRLSALLPLTAGAIFALCVMFNPTPAQASKQSCSPGICEKNGCSERARYCNSTGTGWEVCGTC